MDEIEIKITFDDDLCGCKITRSGNIVMWEELNDKDQVKVCNALAQFYMLFYKAMKGGNNEN